MMEDGFEEALLILRKIFLSKIHAMQCNDIDNTLTDKKEQSNVKMLGTHKYNTKQKAKIQMVWFDC